MIKPWTYFDWKRALHLFFQRLEQRKAVLLDYRSSLEFGTHKHFQPQETQDKISCLRTNTNQTDLRLVPSNRNLGALNSGALPNYRWDMSVSKEQQLHLPASPKALLLYPVSVDLLLQSQKDCMSQVVRIFAFCQTSTYFLLFYTNSSSLVSLIS